MSEKVQVCIKMRGLLPHETDVPVFWCAKENSLYSFDPQTKTPSGEPYVFDHVFNEECTNNHVFDTLVKNLVDATVRGFNSTVFAYGQTASGKTHTMLGNKKENGIIQLSVSSLFDMIRSSGREFLVRVSYMEIYNERVNDLLDSVNENLKIREDDGKIIVMNLTEEIVSDPSKVMELLRKGQKARKQGVTNLNERSSRSHTIFRMIVESGVSEDEEGTIQVSHLNMVDLASSERAGLAGTSDERMKEGCLINLSLFQLGHVVSQLSEGQTQFVNFRDSKLTQILQNSLGGNALTVIICTITSTSQEFTQSTLGFACRAKSVKNQPQVNKVLPDGTLLKKFAQKLEKLEAELEALKKRQPSDKQEAVQRQLEKEKSLNRESQARVDALQKQLIVAEVKLDQLQKEREDFHISSCKEKEILERKCAALEANDITSQEKYSALQKEKDSLETKLFEFEALAKHKLSSEGYVKQLNAYHNSLCKEITALNSKCELEGKDLPELLSLFKDCIMEKEREVLETQRLSSESYKREVETYQKSLCAEIAALSPHNKHQGRDLSELLNIFKSCIMDKEKEQSSSDQKENPVTHGSGADRGEASGDSQLKEIERLKDAACGLAHRVIFRDRDLKSRDNQFQELAKFFPEVVNPDDSFLIGLRKILIYLKKIGSVPKLKSEWDELREERQKREKMEEMELTHSATSTCMKSLTQELHSVTEVNSRLRNELEEANREKNDLVQQCQVLQERLSRKLSNLKVKEHEKLNVNQQPEDAVQEASESESKKRVELLWQELSTARYILAEQGYEYQAPLWVCVGTSTVPYRKMKWLEQRVKELEEELSALQKPQCGTQEDVPLDLTWLTACQKSIVVPSSSNPTGCLNCQEIRAKIINLEKNIAHQNLQMERLNN